MDLYRTIFMTGTNTPEYPFDLGSLRNNVYYCNFDVVKQRFNSRMQEEVELLVTVLGANPPEPYNIIIPKEIYNLILFLKDLELNPEQKLNLITLIESYGFVRYLQGWNQP